MTDTERFVEWSRGTYRVVYRLYGLINKSVWNNSLPNCIITLVCGDLVRDQFVALYSPDNSSGIIIDIDKIDVKGLSVRDDIGVLFSILLRASCRIMAKMRCQRVDEADYVFLNKSRQLGFIGDPCSGKYEKGGAGCGLLDSFVDDGLSDGFDIMAFSEAFPFAPLASGLLMARECKGVLDGSAPSVTVDSKTRQNADSRMSCSIADMFDVHDDSTRIAYAKELIKRVLPRAVSDGRLSEADVKFLRTWHSGTYFQTHHEVPVLFPYDESISDISKRLSKYYDFGYFKDTSIEWQGSTFRLLATYSERSLPVILDWLHGHGFSLVELRSALDMLPFDSAKSDDDDPCVDYFRHLKPGVKRSRITASRKPVQLDLIDLSLQYSGVETMASIKRLADGSIAAKDVKDALHRQIRAHNYSPTKIADGLGIPRRIVIKWCRGELVIHPNELDAMCKFMSIDNLFHGLSR